MSTRDATWSCSCNRMNYENESYCPACGASRIGPIQATEEELREFLADENELDQIHQLYLQPE